MRLFFPLLLFFVCFSCIEEKEQIISSEIATIEFKFRTDPTSSKSDIVTIIATTTDTENLGIVFQVDGLIDSQKAVDEISGESVYLYSLSAKGRSEILSPLVEKQIIEWHGYALFSDGCLHYGTYWTDTVSGVTIFRGGRPVDGSVGLDPICPGAGRVFT